MEVKRPSAAAGWLRQVVAPIRLATQELQTSEGGNVLRFSATIRRRNEGGAIREGREERKGCGLSCVYHAPNQTHTTGITNISLGSS